MYIYIIVTYTCYSIRVHCILLVNQTVHVYVIPMRKNLHVHKVFTDIFRLVTSNVQSTTNHCQWDKQPESVCVQMS